MVKKLLSLAAVAALAINANAYDLPLTSDDTSANAPLYAGWESSYDQATQTITYDGDWKGRGWGFWGNELDGSKYTDLVIKTAPCNVSGNLIVEYAQLCYDENGDVIIEWGNEKHEQSASAFAIGDEEITVRLNPEYKDKILQIYLQCGPISGIETPTITLLSAELVDKSGAPINYVVFEGERVINWWSDAIHIPTDFFEYLVAGSKIAITFSAVDASQSDPCFKMQTLNADWSQTWLPSLANIPTAVVAEDGSDIHVPVTEPCTISCDINEADVAAISAKGVQSIMIVGQGVTISKVEVLPVDAGVGAIESSDNVAPTVYYNLQGVQIANPTNGLYIMRQGTKTSKVIIR